MLKAQDIMTTRVYAVSPETGIEELARLFVERNVNAMPVLDAAGGLFGIVSQEDLVELDRPLHIPTVIAIFDWVLYLESEKKFRDEVERITARKVADICSREVVTCTPETPVSEIAELMTEKKAHLVPVVAGGKVVGVVARLDLIRSMGR
jgi:CBS-domain-containing membrane protein